MTRTLSEKKVLKALDIPDFRHMTKDKVVEFASMLPRMDPEVAKAALAQFPEYAQTMKDLAQTYREEVSEAATSNEKSVQENYAVCNRILDSIDRQLSDPNITSEERASLNGLMLEVADRAAAIDENNKKWWLKVLGIGATVVSVTGVVLAAVLGNNVNVNGIGNQSDDDDDHNLLS